VASRCAFILPIPGFPGIAIPQIPPSVPVFTFSIEGFDLDLLPPIPGLPGVSLPPIPPPIPIFTFSIEGFDLDLQLPIPGLPGIKLPFDIPFTPPTFAIACPLD